MKHTETGFVISMPILALRSSTDVQTNEEFNSDLHLLIDGFAFQKDNDYRDAHKVNPHLS